MPMAEVARLEPRSGYPISVSFKVGVRVRVRVRNLRQVINAFGLKKLPFPPPMMMIRVGTLRVGRNFSFPR